MLRALNSALCLAMLVLAVAQVGRPEWWLWVVAFLVPAFWAFMAGFRHRAFRAVRWLGWLWGCVALWVALLWQHWPQTAGFWRTEVWAQDAAARTGLSLMAALAALLAALFTAYHKR